MDDSKQKEDPKCPCGSIPLGAMFRRDNGACSACGKQVPAPTVSDLPEIAEHPGYYDHGRFGHYYPGAIYLEMSATARKLHALVTSQQQEIETLNNQVGSLRWQIERIEEECTAAGWSLQWSDGGGDKCPFGWTRNPYLNIGTREDYIARIAALEAQLSGASAQAPRGCAGFEAHCDGSHFCVCGLPESAPCHQEPTSESVTPIIGEFSDSEKKAFAELAAWQKRCEQPAEWPDVMGGGTAPSEFDRVVLETPGWSEQPAPLVEVPPMPSHNFHLGAAWVAENDCLRIHAAAVALAERCERAEWYARVTSSRLAGLEQECSSLRAQLAEAQSSADEWEREAAERLDDSNNARFGRAIAETWFAAAGIRAAHLEDQLTEAPDALRQEREQCAKVLYNSGDPLGACIIRALPEEDKR